MFRTVKAGIVAAARLDIGHWGNSTGQVLVLKYQTNSTLRQGVPMTDQLEFNLRAMLCRQLARREPENRVLWMAEAETWSRLSKKNGRGRAKEKIGSGIAASFGERSDRPFSTLA